MRNSPPRYGADRRFNSQEEANLYDNRGQKVRNGVQTPPPPMRPERPAPGVADQDARVSYETNDTLIRRDFTPWFPMGHFTPAGTGRASWAAAGPARPALTQRNVTVNPRVGNSRARFAQNPLAPGTGLHTNPQYSSIGTVARYTDPKAPQMSVARQNRLSPARYDGQSYSQTTLTQGA